MKKSILNLGKALNKAEQQLINGGEVCSTPQDCSDEYNRTHFDPLPPSAFLCYNNTCIFL